MSSKREELDPDRRNGGLDVNTFKKILSVSEAREILLDYFDHVDGESITIDKAINRVPLHPVFAKLHMPPFDNSSMDGFALRSADSQSATKNNPVIMDVVGDIQAGLFPDVTIGPGQSARIVSGAMIPDGADAVIPVEETNHAQFTPGSPPTNIVEIFSAVYKGDYIRSLGQDFREGDLLIGANKRLRPQDIGVIAMQGIGKIQVFRRPVVGLISTGDELLEPGDSWIPGKIFNANSYTLNALLHQNGCVCINSGTSPDSASSIRIIFESAIDEKVDLILTSAGVSMGAFDFVRSVVEREGRLTFWKVNMRPGKPLVFGSYKDIPLIGLPGNPVSAFIGFEVFVKPVINKLSGLAKADRSYQTVRLADPIESDGRESYLRATISIKNGIWEAKIAGHQGSGNLMSLVYSNALIIIPAGVRYLPPGAEVQAWLLDNAIC